MIRLALLFSFLAVPALADEAKMAFYIRNNAPSDIALELYGVDRRTIWPGDGKVYLIDKAAKKSIPVTCHEGERICWGAWMNGNDRISYGVGPDNAYACETCCFICVGSSVATIDVGP